MDNSEFRIVLGGMDVLFRYCHTPARFYLMCERTLQFSTPYVFWSHEQVAPFLPHSLAPHKTRGDTVVSYPFLIFGDFHLFVSAKKLLKVIKLVVDVDWVA